MTRGPVQVIGAGGHAKVVIATLIDVGHDVVAVWDDASERRGTFCLGIEIQGPIANAKTMEAVPAVIAIGDNRARSIVASSHSLRWISAIHPTAYVHPSAQLGVGTVVFAGCVVQPESVIGRHVIVNTSASIDHDCRVGDFAHLAPGARLCGGVSVGEGALFGVAACARPGVRIGAWSVVGAGASVVEDVAPGITVVGTPARRR